MGFTSSRLRRTETNYNALVKWLRKGLSKVSPGSWAWKKFQITIWNSNARGFVFKIVDVVEMAT